VIEGVLPAAPAGSPGALRDHARALRNCADALDDLADRTRHTSRDVRERADWQGAAADGYSSFCDATIAPVDVTPGKLRALAGSLDRQADTLSWAQSAVDDANTAAQQEAAAEPPEPTVVATAQATARATAQRAQQQVEAGGQEATADAEDAKAWYEKWWEGSEPVRKVIDEFLTPYGLVGGDHWTELLVKGSEQPWEWLEEADKAIETAEKAAEGGEANAGEELIEAANTVERVGGRADAFDAFAPGVIRAGASHLRTVGVVTKGVSVLGLISDAGTLKDPADPGAMGWVDRGAAGVNGTIIVADLVTLDVPVVGEVVLVGTGLYLAGDWAYHNVQPVHDFANAAASHVGSIAEGGWHAGESGYHSASHWIGSHL
jgi:hypothetical protein